MKKLTVVQVAPEIGVFTAVDQARLAKHPVVLAFEFRQRVAHHMLEVGIGVQHLAAQIELDDRHRPVQCGEFAAGGGFLLYLGGDIQRVLDHLQHLPALIQQRVIARLQPDGRAAAVHAFERAGDKLAGAQVAP